MQESATNRTPYEVWEHILLYSIAITSAPVLDVLCTPSNYLAFKRTCGDGESIIQRYAYYEAQSFRRSLRLVCRSWRVFADRWDVRERWMRITSLEWEISDNEWRGLQRVDFQSHRRVSIGAWVPLEMQKLCATLINWKTLGFDGGFGGIRLKRLEMLFIEEISFDQVFTALCEASAALKCLGSLSLSIPNIIGHPLRRISKHFPDLVHLTLRTCFVHIDENEDKTFAEDELLGKRKPDGKAIYIDSLRLKKLEVLFLIPRPGLFRLANWSLPALRTVHVQNLRAEGMWANKIYPFLLRHASTIETLDLDDSNEISLSGVLSKASGQSPFSPCKVAFWDMFPHLRLLRCSLNRHPFDTYPIEGVHPFECLANADPTDSSTDFVDLVKPWVEGGRVKRLDTLVLFGVYFSSGLYRRDNGPAKGLMKQLQWNGTRVTKPTGKLWFAVL